MKTATKSMIDYSSEILSAVHDNNLDTAHNLILEQCAVQENNPQMVIMALQKQLIENVQEVAVTLLAMQIELDAKNKQDMI